MKMAIVRRASWLVGLVLGMAWSWDGLAVTVRQDGTGDGTTITEALQRVSLADPIIEIADSGTYTEDLTILGVTPRLGAPPARLVVRAAQGCQPVILAPDLASRVPELLPEGPDRMGCVVHDDGVTIEGLTFRSQSPTLNAARFASLLAINGSHVTVRRCAFYGQRMNKVDRSLVAVSDLLTAVGGIPATDVLLEQCVFQDGDTGLYLYPWKDINNACDATVRDSTFVHCVYKGIRSDGRGTLTVERCTFLDNPGGGIYASAAETAVRDCVLVGNDVFGINVESETWGLYAHCTIQGSYIGESQGVGLWVHEGTATVELSAIVGSGPAFRLGMDSARDVLIAATQCDFVRLPDPPGQEQLDVWLVETAPPSALRRTLYLTDCILDAPRLINAPARDVHFLRCWYAPPLPTPSGIDPRFAFPVERLDCREEPIALTAPAAGDLRPLGGPPGGPGSGRSWQDRVAQAQAWLARAAR